MVDGSEEIKVEDKNSQPSTRVVCLEGYDKIARARQHGDVSSRGVVGVEGRGGGGVGSVA